MVTVAKTPRVTTIVPSVQSAGPFFIGFRLFDRDAVDVYLDGARATGFTVGATFSGGFDDNATITLNSPVAAGTVIRIDGSMRSGRASGYQPTDPSVIQKINVELGRIWASLLELRRDANRALRGPMEVPVSDLGQGRALIATGTGFAAGPDIDQIVNAQDYAERAEMAMAITLGTANFTLADLDALKNSPTVFPLGSTILLRDGAGSFVVVASGHDFVTVGGMKVRALTRSVTAHGVDGVDDQPAMARAIAMGGDIHFPARDYPFRGPVETRSHVALLFAEGAILKPFGPSGPGGYITNVTADPDDRVQSGVLLDNVQLDGAGQPAPYYTTVASATTTTITLPAGASTVDDAYKGLIVQMLSGALTSQYRTITGYVGSTRTATLDSALSSAPAASDQITIGSNENGIGFARGLSNLQIFGGTVANFGGSQQVPFGQGGKTLNLEQGVYGASGQVPNSKDVYTHLFIQGKAGLIGDQSAEASRITLSLGHAEKVGSFVSVINTDNAAGISGDGGQVLAVLTGGTYRNAGHAPHRIVNGNHVKSGIINLGGANGVTIGDIRGVNDPGYPNVTPGYPTDYASRVGFGLSGNVGALIWGHARNTELHNIHHTGDLDAIVHVARCRALGDDAAPTGQVSQMFGWHMRAIRVAGTVGQMVQRDTVLNTPGNELSGYWQLEAWACTGNLVPPQWSNGQNLILELTETSTGKTVIGTAAQIVKRGNSFASLPEGTTDLRVMDRRTFTIPNDTAVSFSPMSSAGILRLISQTSELRNIISFRLDPTTPQAEAYRVAPNLTIQQGPALSGTTGGVSAFTLSVAADGLIYLQNRRGVPITVSLVMDVV